MNLLVSLFCDFNVWGGRYEWTHIHTYIRTYIRIVKYILKVLDPTRKTQSRLHAEIAHASIAAIVCVRLFACVCICVRLRVLFAIECVRVRACNRTYMRAIALTCMWSHLIKDHQIKLRAHAHVHVYTCTYIYKENTLVSACARVHALGSAWVCVRAHA